MSEPVLTAQEALKWYESTSDHWRGFLSENPKILALPCDIANTSTVGQLLQHIVAVELRYAERIASHPETTYEQVPYDSVPSSRLPLLGAGPLRTGRDRFRSSSSSPSNASFRETRLWYGKTFAVNPVVAFRMEQGAVFCTR